MPCLAPPPAQIEATIHVGAAPDYALTFVANPVDGSANYIAPNGDLDFSCFQGAINVKFSIAASGVWFYTGYGRDAVSFVDDARQRATKQPVGSGHHQFRRGITHGDVRTITFEYHNDWDCGAGDNVKRCAQSAYGLYLGDAGGFLRHIDPIVGNGGNGQP